MLKFLNHFKKSRPTDPLEIKIIQARHSFFAFLWDGSEGRFTQAQRCPMRGGGKAADGPQTRQSFHCWAASMVFSEAAVF